MLPSIMLWGCVFVLVHTWSGEMLPSAAVRALREEMEPNRGTASPTLTYLWPLALNTSVTHKALWRGAQWGCCLFVSLFVYSTQGREINYNQELNWEVILIFPVYVHAHSKPSLRYRVNHTFECRSTCRWQIYSGATWSQREINASVLNTGKPAEKYVSRWKKQPNKEKKKLLQTPKN